MNLIKLHNEWMNNFYVLYVSGVQRKKLQIKLDRFLPLRTALATLDKNGFKNRNRKWYTIVIIVIFKRVPNKHRVILLSLCSKRFIEDDSTDDNKMRFMRQPEALKKEKYLCEITIQFLKGFHNRFHKLYAFSIVLQSVQLQLSSTDFSMAH